MIATLNHTQAQHFAATAWRNTFHIERMAKIKSQTCLKRMIKSAARSSKSANSFTVKTQSQSNFNCNYHHLNIHPQRWPSRCGWVFLKHCGLAAMIIANIIETVLLNKSNYSATLEGGYSKKWFHHFFEYPTSPRLSSYCKSAKYRIEIIKQLLHM